MSVALQLLATHGFHSKLKPKSSQLNTQPEKTVVLISVTTRVCAIWEAPCYSSLQTHLIEPSQPPVQQILPFYREKQAQKSQTTCPAYTAGSRTSIQTQAWVRLWRCRQRYFRDKSLWLGPGFPALVGWLWAPYLTFLSLTLLIHKEDEKVSALQVNCDHQRNNPEEVRIFKTRKGC